jgi:hypothetical protein
VTADDPQSDCPFCHGTEVVNVGRTGFPPVLVLCFCSAAMDVESDDAR